MDDFAELVADYVESTDSALGAVEETNDVRAAEPHLREMRRAMEKILSLEEILAAQDLEERTVDVPEWGGSVRIRAITKARQQSIRQQATLKANTQTQKAGEIDTGRLEMLLLVESVVEPKLSAEHIPRLREKASAPIERILKAILALNGLAEEAVDRAESTFQEG